MDDVKSFLAKVLRIHTFAILQSKVVILGPGEGSWSRSHQVAIIGSVRERVSH